MSPYQAARRDLLNSLSALAPELPAEVWEAHNAIALKFIYTANAAYHNLPEQTDG